MPVQPALQRAFAVAATLGVLGAASGCVTIGPKPADPTPQTRLSATLLSPTNVKLDWSGNESGLAGRVVEYTNEPDGDYTILAFTPPAQTTYTHADLMPDTSFYYRVRPYFGPASAVVDVKLPDGGFDDKQQNDDNTWAQPRKVPGKGAATVSMRGALTAATPTDFKATIVHANGIQFTWTDHAADEDGYLLEVRAAGAAAFSVVDVVDPDVTSVGLVTLPEEKTASYRVRPFYYGPASNVVREQTGGQ
jgi:hypothetical protein